MNAQAKFLRQGYSLDVLTHLVNLASDRVFTLLMDWCGQNRGLKFEVICRRIIPETTLRKCWDPHNGQSQNRLGM